MLNDLRMDTGESVRHMLRASRWLKPGGLALMTLKLPGRNQRRSIDRAIEDLQGYYSLIGARQLFHNRREISLVLATY